MPVREAGAAYNALLAIRHKCNTCSVMQSLIAWELHSNNRVTCPRAFAKPCQCRLLSAALLPQGLLLTSWCAYVSRNHDTLAARCC